MLNPYIEASDIDLALLSRYMVAGNAHQVAWAIDIAQAALNGYQLSPGDLVVVRPTLRMLLWDRRVVDDPARVSLAMALHTISRQDSLPEVLGLPAEAFYGLRAKYL